MKKLILITLIISIYCNLNAQGWKRMTPIVKQNNGGIISFSIGKDNSIWAFSEDFKEINEQGTGLKIHRSLDNGQTWQDININFNPLSYPTNLFALTKNNVFASLVDMNEGVKSYNTRDGGVSWQPIDTKITTWINLIDMSNKFKGIAIGDPDDKGFIISTTNDGGCTWRRLDQSKIPNNFADEFGFSNSYYRFNKTIAFVTSMDRIIYSHDDGETWESTETPSKLPIITVAGTDKLMYSIHSDFSKITDIEFEIYKSEDGGNNWKNITPADNKWLIRDIKLVPGTNTLVTVHNESYFLANPKFQTRISNDEGKTWITIDTIANVREVKFTENTKGIAVPAVISVPTKEIVLQDYIGKPLRGILVSKEMQLKSKVLAADNSNNIILQIRSEEKNEECVVLINDLSGKLLYKKHFDDINDINENIDVSRFISGLYYVRISTNEGVKTHTYFKN